MSKVIDPKKSNTPSSLYSPSTMTEYTGSQAWSMISLTCCIIIIYFFYPVVASTIGYMQGIPYIGPNPYPTIYIFGIPFVEKN